MFLQRLGAGLDSEFGPTFVAEKSIATYGLTNFFFRAALRT